MIVHPSSLVLRTQDTKLIHRLSDEGKDLNRPLEMFGKKWHLLCVDYDSTRVPIRKLEWGELVPVPETVEQETARVIPDAIKCLENFSPTITPPRMVTDSITALRHLADRIREVKT